MLTIVLLLGYPECEFWVQPDWAFWREQYNAFYLNAQLVVPASGQFWLRYDISGPAAIEYRITGKIILGFSGCSVLG